MMRPGVTLHADTIAAALERLTATRQWPVVSEESSSEVVGEYLSEDERGLRVAVARSWALKLDDIEVAVVTSGAHGAVDDARSAVCAALWGALGLPVPAASRTLLMEGTVTPPRRTEAQAWAIQLVVDERGPRLDCEIWFPHARTTDPSDSTRRYSHVIGPGEAHWAPSLKVPGAWYVRASRQLSSVMTEEDRDRLSAAVASVLAAR